MNANNLYPRIAPLMEYIRGALDVAPNYEAQKLSHLACLIQEADTHEELNHYEQALLVVWPASNRVLN